MKQTHLRLSYYYTDITEGPRAYCAKFGITFEQAVPQSMADQVWLFDCKNIPDPLPHGFSILKLTPEEVKHWRQ